MHDKVRIADCMRIVVCSEASCVLAKDLVCLLAFTKFVVTWIIDMRDVESSEIMQATCRASFF